MSSLGKPTLRGRVLFRTVLHLSRGFWRSPEAKWGALLLAAAIALELFMVQATFFVAEAQRDVVDALESREAAAFATSVGSFVLLALLSVVVSTYRIYLRQLVEIRWRRGLTGEFLGRWIAAPAYCQSQLHDAGVDNPDQRIAEDVRDFVASALGLSLSLLAAVATLWTFGGLLWRLSADWEILAFGEHVRVPGVLLWVASAFAAISMIVTHLVGRRLVPINFERLRREADFRYGLVQFRDNVEQVVFSRGEPAERAGAVDRFGHVVTAFVRLVRAERDLNLLTQGIGQLSGMLPILLATPAYFANLLTLGTILQARIAYDQVSASLNWFVHAYREIARWRANVERLAGFDVQIEESWRRLAASALEIGPSPNGSILLEDVRLETPDGRVLVSDASASLAPGERAVIDGVSGSGKTALLRALAGFWPFGSGRIERPERERMLFLPQLPYLPDGTLRAAIAYPQPENAVADERLREALDAVGVGYLARQLDRVEPWARRLSAHEQQLIALARVLLDQPDFLLLDDSTSGLDEAQEEQLYALLVSRLPNTGIVAIGPRAGARALLPHRWSLVQRGDAGARLEAA